MIFIFNIIQQWEPWFYGNGLNSFVATHPGTEDCLSSVCFPPRLRPETPRAHLGSPYQVLLPQGRFAEACDLVDLICFHGWILFTQTALKMNVKVGLVKSL